MSETLKRYATPFITGLFLVSLVSGVALFFHVGNATFHEMHEWLSMVLILPFVLHLWRNWRAFLNYFGKLPFTLAMGVSLIAAIVFALPGSGEGGAGGPPQFAFAHTVMMATPATVAPVLGQDATKLVDMLKSKGFTAASPELALTDIAVKSNKSEAELAAALVAAN